MFHKKRGNMLGSVWSALGSGTADQSPTNRLTRIARPSVWSVLFKNYAATGPLGPPVSLREAAERSRYRALRERRFVICLTRFRLNWHRIGGDAADTAKRERLHHRMPSDSEGAARMGGTDV